MTQSNWTHYWPHNSAREPYSVAATIGRTSDTAGKPERREHRANRKAGKTSKYDVRNFA